MKTNTGWFIFANFLITVFSIGKQELYFHSHCKKKEKKKENNFFAEMILKIFSTFFFYLLGPILIELQLKWILTCKLAEWNARHSYW